MHTIRVLYRGQASRSTDGLVQCVVAVRTSSATLLTARPMKKTENGNVSAVAIETVQLSIVCDSFFISIRYYSRALDDEFSRILPS